MVGLGMAYALWLLCFGIVYGAFMLFGVAGILFILVFLAGYEISFRIHKGRWRTIYD